MSRKNEEIIKKISIDILKLVGILFILLMLIVGCTGEVEEENGYKNNINSNILNHLETLNIEEKDIKDYAETKKETSNGGVEYHIEFNVNNEYKGMNENSSYSIYYDENYNVLEYGFSKVSKYELPYSMEVDIKNAIQTNARNYFRNSSLKCSFNTYTVVVDNKNDYIVANVTITNPQNSNFVEAKYIYYIDSKLVEVVSYR